MDDEQRPLIPVDQRLDGPSESDFVTNARTRTKRYLTSKAGHYSVLVLVSLDISSIFADLILQLLTCEGQVPRKDGEDAQEALGIVSLVFSCLFMVELLASIWAFGQRYFRSWFHCLDATVITVSFVIDVLLRGIVEEIGSLVIVLRLFRVFKIIEELSAGAEGQMAPLKDHLEDLEKQNSTLRQQIDDLRAEQISSRPNKSVQR